MGLDTFAVIVGQDGEAEPAPDEPFKGLRLCGGMYSGGSDSSSIRGKVYAAVVSAATGQSLYQDRIEPATVTAMAARFRAAVEEAKRAGIEVLDVAGEEINAREAEDLARWLDICAERAYAIEAWR